MIEVIKKYFKYIWSSEDYSYIAIYYGLHCSNCYKTPSLFNSF